MEKRLQVAQRVSRDTRQKTSVVAQEEMMVAWLRLVVVEEEWLAKLCEMESIRLEVDSDRLWEVFCCMGPQCS